MNKNKILTFLIFFLLIKNINAYTLKFGWSIGNLNIYGDALNKEINFDVNILHFKWIIKNFSVDINILDINDIYNTNEYKYSILPVKLAYVPLKYNDKLFFSVYGKFGWQITENKNNNDINHGIFNSIGINLYFFPKLRLYYSPYFSLFSEYDTYNKLKIGLEIDISALVFMWVPRNKK